jgi:hypothetical protein
MNEREATIDMMSCERRELGASRNVTIVNVGAAVTEYHRFLLDPFISFSGFH